MKWSPQQDEALKAVSQWLKDPSGNQVFRLFGWAGTGKSTLAKRLAEGIGKVHFAAFTGKAALVMRKRGCRDAGTIHSLIYSLDDEDGGEPSFELNPQSPVRHANLVIIDEVSMVGGDLAKDLLSFGTRILVLGDPFQLPPVNTSGENKEGFFTSQDPDFMLTEIHRQAADNPIIRMSMDIREGGALQLGGYGDSKVIKRKDVMQNEVLSADQVIVGRNRSRVDFNNRIRELRNYTREIPEHGERIICLRNNQRKKLINGQIWTVHSSEQKKPPVIKMVIRAEDSGFKSYPLKVTTHQAFFDGTDSELSWDEKRGYDQFTYGYALTCHKSQGSQWDNVYLFDESRAFRQDWQKWLYTAVTRAAERITVAV